jgi:L-fucose mutarotase
MLKSKLLHPEILSVLGRSGHGSKILIADGNYPFATGSPASAAKVYLNLMPGKISATEALEALVNAIPIETALVMVPPDGAQQAIFEEFRRILPHDLKLTEKQRFDFYADVKSPDTALVIATGEQRRFANILLTIGVIKGPNE